MHTMLAEQYQRKTKIKRGQDEPSLFDGFAEEFSGAFVKNAITSVGDNFYEKVQQRQEMVNLEREHNNTRDPPSILGLLGEAVSDGIIDSATSNIMAWLEEEKYSVDTI